MSIINPKRFHPNITQNAVDTALAPLQTIVKQIEVLWIKFRTEIPTIEDSEQLALLSETLDEVNRQLLDAIAKMDYM